MSPSAQHLRRRATRGAAYVAIRTGLIQLLSLAATYAFARLLVPSQLGTVAFGQTLLLAARFLSDGGLGASLIRRTETPTSAELSTVLGVQLILTGALAATIAALATQAGEVGAVTAIMAISLPFTALRTPPTIMLERELEYRTIATSETAVAFVFNAWAILGVWLGLGVWGVATAAVPSELVGTIVMLVACRQLPLRPALNPQIARKLAGFGVRYQAVPTTVLIRGQVLNLGVTAVSGLPVLGLWSFTYRIMQMPFWIFTALWRVSYPALSRLSQVDADLKRTVEAMARVSVIAAGAMLVPLAGSGRELIPAVFGSRWSAAATIVPFASLGLIISGPISVASSGYLYASGDARTPLRATVTNSLIWLTLGLALLRPLGLAALGIAWMAGSWSEAAIFSLAVRRRLHSSLIRVVGPVALMAVASVILGYVLSSLLAGGLASALVAAAASATTFLVGSAAMRPGDYRMLFSLLARAAN